MTHPIQEALENRCTADVLVDVDVLKKFLGWPRLTKIRGFRTTPELSEKNQVLVRVVSPYFDALEEGQPVPIKNAHYEQNEHGETVFALFSNSGKTVEDLDDVPEQEEIPLRDIVKEKLLVDQEFRDDVVDMLADIT